MTGPKGMLTLDQLRTKIGAGEIDTVIVAFADHYGRLHGKRFDAGFFIEEIYDHGGHACDYLLTVDMEMNPVPGYRYASWEQGYGDFHMVPDPSTMRVASWLDRTALVLCDLQDTRTHEPVSVAPRSVLRRQIALAAEAGINRASRVRAGVLHLRRQLPRRRRKTLRGHDACRLVRRGLPPPAGHAGRALQRARAPAPGGVRHSRRELEGRVGPRTARDEHPLRGRTVDGRPARSDEAWHEGDRGGTRRQRDVHGKAVRGGGRVKLPHPPQPLEGRGSRFPGRDSVRASARLGRLPLVPRRLDGSRQRADGLLRARR